MNATTHQNAPTRAMAGQTRGFRAGCGVMVAAAEGELVAIVKTKDLLSSRLVRRTLVCGKIGRRATRTGAGGGDMRIGEIIHEIEVLPAEEPILLPEPRPNEPAPPKEPEPA